MLGNSIPATSHAAERYAFDIYGTDQGLRNQVVTVLHQDREGFLWVGTANGLYRYDGHRFLTFSVKEGLPGAEITMLYETADGTLWVGTDHGLAWRSGTAFVASRNEALRGLIYRQAFASQPDGRMLVTTAKGLAAATAQAFGRDVPLEVLAQPEGLGGPRATSVYVDAQGAIWFGCGSSVCRREHDRVEVWGGAEGVPSDVWQFITKDVAGNLWVRSRRRLIELEAGARRFKTQSLEDVAPLNFAYPSLAFDATGALLVPTNTGLAVRRDGTWSRVGHRQGLPSSTVTAALQDAEGSLWVGTTSGLARWAGYREWESFTEVEGLSGDDILALDEDRAGGIWAGTAGGLSHGVRQNGAWKWTSAGGGLAWVANLAQAPDGAIWLSTVESRVVRFDPRTGAAQRYGEFDGSPYSVFIDSSSHVWVIRTYALFRGSTRLPFGGFEQVRPPGSTSKTVFTRVVEDSRGDLWFGSYNGLFRLSGGKWFHYHQTDGLATNRISSLTNSPDGDVLATYVQDPRIDRVRGDGERVRVERVDRSQGLEADRVDRVRFDREGRMWAMTDHGAALREGGKWVHFDRSDGLISDGCSAFLGAADGSVWIGTGRGLSHMLHPRVPAARTAPSVTFSEVRLGNRVVDSFGLLVEQQPEPLTVKLSTLNLARGSRIQYRYRCIGLNERWSEAARPELSLDYPRAGRYRLELQARWPDGPWGPVAALAVEVRARWFESWWFIALLAALVCGAAWAAWKLRERHNAAARAGLELEVRERTTELSAANQQLRQEITERELADRETERLEGELLQAKRLESIGRLAGGVAHDFNNLLTVINGHCDVMLSRLGAIDPLRESIHEVREAGERAAELTRRLLAFSRKQILQPAPVSPGEIVSGIEGMLRRLLRADIELITQFQPEAGQVMADRGQIESVLINLVVNARDAIAGPGRIMIVVREVEVAGGQPAGRDLKPGRYVRIAVSDTGHGMDEKTLQDVFEPFFTTKEVGKGTGLGLAMVHGVIKQSGGAIAVQSLPGKGTTFEILLPRLEGLGPAAMAHSPETASTGGRETVLLVEDQAAVRRLTASLLTQAGYAVTEAADGMSALAQLEKFAQPVDLLVTDVVMPLMTGPELARRVRGQSPSTCVLYISGYAAESIAPGSVADGGMKYLAKPFTRAELLSKVREALDRAREG